MLNIFIRLTGEGIERKMDLIGKIYLQEIHIPNIQKNIPFLEIVNTKLVLETATKVYVISYP